jgi:peptide/nickel transport system substrate-binding protein
MRMVRRAALVAAIAAGLFSLAACNPGKGAGSAGGAQRITLGVVLEPPNLDPTAGAAAAIDEVVYANVFEGLTRIGPDGSVLPALAKSWTVSDDAKVWTFALNTGVTFHDGSTFDANDVKFSLDRARAPDSANAQKELYQVISSVDVVDPATVRLTLSQPDADLAFNLGLGDAVIVAPETAAGNTSKPIGTGPFRFENWARGSAITLVRNPTYWGKPVALTQATFRFFADPNAAYQALVAGDVDGFPDFPAPELLKDLADNPKYKVTIGQTEGETILAINNSKPPFNDVRIRRAIAHAIDRKAVIEGAMSGYGTPIGSHFSPADPAYVDLTGRYPYDPVVARKLLEAAGLPNGFITTLKLPPTPYARRGGEIVASQLKAIGIDARIEAVEWAPWLDQVFKNKNYDLTLISHTEPRDIGIYARDYYFGYNSPAFKALMTRLSATIDPAQRRALLGDAQRMISEDSVNAFLFQLPKLGAWSVRVKGQWTSSPVQANDLTGVSVDP